MRHVDAFETLDSIFDDQVTTGSLLSVEALFSLRKQNTYIKGGASVGSAGVLGDCNMDQVFVRQVGIT